MAYDRRHDDETMDRHHRDSRESGRSRRERSAFFDDDRDSRSSRGWSDRDRSEDSRWRNRGERDEPRFSDDNNRGLPMDETARLIASNKVEGTSVYDRYGDKVGSIHNFMVDKYSGEVKYAVLRHSGGFLGLGERYYPLEWSDLTYDTEKDGYRLHFAEDDLRDMRSFGKDDEWRRRPRGEHRRDERSRHDRDDDRSRHGSNEGYRRSSNGW